MRKRERLLLQQQRQPKWGNTHHDTNDDDDDDEINEHFPLTFWCLLPWWRHFAGLLRFIFVHQVKSIPPFPPSQPFFPSRHRLHRWKNYHPNAIPIDSVRKARILCVRESAPRNRNTANRWREDDVDVHATVGGGDGEERDVAFSNLSIYLSIYLSTGWRQTTAPDCPSRAPAANVCKLFSHSWRQSNQRGRRWFKCARVGWQTHTPRSIAARLIIIRRRARVKALPVYFLLILSSHCRGSLFL